MNLQGFTSIRIDPEKKMLYLRFDPSSPNLKNVTGIILKGLANTDVTKRVYNYTENRYYEKDRKTWFVEINITNNMDVIALQKSHVIMNFKNGEVPDYNACHLSHIAFSVNKKLREAENGCSGNMCFLDLRRGQDDQVFYAQIVQGDGIISLNSVKIEEPLDIDMTIKIRC